MAKINLVKSCLSLKKTLKYTYQQRDAANGCCESFKYKVENMV